MYVGLGGIDIVFNREIKELKPDLKEETPIKSQKRFENEATEMLR